MMKSLETSLIIRLETYNDQLLSTFFSRDSSKSID